MNIETLNRSLGNIDLYLLDQILKGKIDKEYKILDAGCGEGRNLTYFINNDYDIYGVDANPTAIKMLRMRAKNYEPDRFIQTSIEEMIFPPKVFDYIISSAVLHFAKDHDHFNSMIQAMVKVLKPGGTLFVRMTTNLAFEHLSKTTSGVYALPDGSNRYLFDVNKLEDFLKDHLLELVEPLKSVVVYNQRSMGTMLFKKS